MAEELELQLTPPERTPGSTPTEDEIRSIQEKHPLLGRWSKLWEEVHGYKRAFVIEFAGMPKAGKSTTIDNVRHFFSYGHKLKVKVSGKDAQLNKVSGKDARPYIVHTPAEGVSQRTPRVLKDDLIDFNTWAGAYALQELIEARHDRFHDLVILDRGPWDAGCWLQHYISDPETSQKDPLVKKVAEFFQLPCWGTESDLHVIMTIDPAKAAERESKRLIEHHGPAAKRPLMESMLRIYSESFKTLLAAKTKECEKVGALSAIQLNTTDYSTNRAAEFEVISQALKILELKIEGLKESTAEAAVQAITKELAGKVRGAELTSLTRMEGELAARLKQLTPLQRYDVREQLAERKKDLDLVLSARGEAESIMRVLSECIEKTAAS
jgi:hypothetical protein